MPTHAPPPLYPSPTSPSAQALLSTFSLTTTELQTLATLAAAAKSTAHCPYSRFRVGATLLTADGSYVSGANVENASSPVGICAERVAIARAVTDLKGRWAMGAFKALAVSTDIAPPASPCGMCRQFMREFCEFEMPVFMFDKDGQFMVLTLEQLLPMSFGPEALA